jgi:hypothetical protein
VKRLLSIKGILLVTLVLVMALGSGSAMAGRQASVATQDALTRTDGATIVTSSLCTLNDSEFTVWGSGFASGEIVILSVVKDADTAIIWSTGNANVAGAFEITKTIVTKPPNATSDKARWPGSGLFSVEVLSVRGRLTTTPVLFVDDKCPGSDSM